MREINGFIHTVQDVLFHQLWLSTVLFIGDIKSAS